MGRKYLEKERDFEKTERLRERGRAKRRNWRRSFGSRSEVCRRVSSDDV